MRWWCSLVESSTTGTGVRPFGDGWGGWLLMALRWWGMGSGTLLGPEGSAVRLLLEAAPLFGGVWLVLWCPPFALHLT